MGAFPTCRKGRGGLPDLGWEPFLPVGRGGRVVGKEVGGLPLSGRGAVPDDKFAFRKVLLLHHFRHRASVPVTNGVRSHSAETRRPSVVMDLSLSSDGLRYCGDGSAPQCSSNLAAWVRILPVSRVSQLGGLGRVGSNPTRATSQSARREVAPS